jgi:serine/threonine protein kinase
LGDGSFAKVYAVQDTRGHQLAAKVISMKHKKEYALDFMREAMLQMSMEHPNLLKAYRAFVRCEQLEMVIITDICEGGSLSKSIANLNGPAQQQIMLGLSEGLAYLHNERKIIHRDIKLENILLKGGVAKIADFGLSRFTPKNA